MGFVDGAAKETFERVVREVQARQDMATNEELRPRFDPKEHHDYLKRSAGNRKSRAYHKALENHGFQWFSQWNLPPLDGRPHPEGQWRNQEIGAFYPSDLVTLFPGGPAQFDRWCREQRMLKARAAPKAELRKILLAKE